MDLNPNDPNNRPPYVRFKTVAVEDRAASLQAGHYVSKDVIYAMITRPGQKDTVEREAKSWLEDLHKQAQDGRIPTNWPMMFQHAFDAFAKGEEVPENGTPIKGWQVLSPAQQQAVTQAGIVTVEDLAAASAEALGRVGMGAIAWQLKAQTWLKVANDTGRIAERLQTLERDNEQLKQDKEVLVKEIQRLQELLPSKEKGKATL